MTRSLALFPLAALAGCIIYDTDGKCRHCGDDDDWYEDTGSIGGDDTGGDDTDAPAASFLLSPDEALAGETFIASLTVEGAPFDLATIEDIEFFDGVTVCTSSLRPDELLLTLVVAADAAVGPVDMLLHLSGGEREFVAGALTIVAQGADDGSGDGGSGGDGDPPDDGTGTGGDDGTGTGGGDGTGTGGDDGTGTGGDDGTGTGGDDGTGTGGDDGTVGDGC